MKKERKAFFFSILLGLILILAGVFLPIPGGALTTSEYSNGKKQTTMFSMTSILLLMNM